MSNEKAILNIRSAVDRYLQNSKPTRYLYLGITALLAMIVLSMIVHSYFIANELDSFLGPGGVGAALLIFVFRQLRETEKCLWEAHTLDIIAEAGGMDKLLSALENITCKKLSNNLFAIDGGANDE